MTPFRDHLLVELADAKLAVLRAREVQSQRQQDLKRARPLDRIVRGISRTIEPFWVCPYGIREEITYLGDTATLETLVATLSPIQWDTSPNSDLTEVGYTAYGKVGTLAEGVRVNLFLHVKAPHDEFEEIQ